ncbi:MAG: thiamine-phosphate kinase [Rickettsiales bacterium]
MDEFDLIERYFRPLARDFPGAFSLSDDAALITPRAGETHVVTTDMLLEGVHFFGNESADLIAKKALRTNLSDLAAKGAKPVCYFLSIGLPDRVDEIWMKRFCQGLQEDQSDFHVSLAGGDTTRSRHGLIISISAVGTVPQNGMLRRSGAAEGECLCVSGTLGDAALGLAILKGEFSDIPENLKSYAISRYHLPQPRCELGMRLRNTATSSMDISDGIFQDAGHLLNASDVGAVIELEKIPSSPAMQWVKWKNPMRWLELISSGDDYELLFTVASRVPEDATIIGTITQNKKLEVHDAEGKAVMPLVSGYRHGRPGRDVGP